MNQEQWGKLLPQAGLCGIYHLPPSGLKTLGKAAESLDYAYFTVDFQESGELKSALGILGEKLAFPEYYGANLDALSDCLTDFSWNEAAGYVLVISGADALHAEGDVFGRLNAVFAHAIDEWRGQKTPFWIFYDMRADGLSALPTLA